MVLMHTDVDLARSSPSGRSLLLLHVHALSWPSTTVRPSIMAAPWSRSSATSTTLNPGKHHCASHGSLLRSSASQLPPARRAHLRRHHLARPLAQPLPLPATPESRSRSSSTSHLSPCDTPYSLLLSQPPSTEREREREREREGERATTQEKPAKILAPCTCALMQTAM